MLFQPRFGSPSQPGSRTVRDRLNIVHEVKAECWRVVVRRVNRPHVGATILDPPPIWKLIRGNTKLEISVSPQEVVRGVDLQQI